MSENDQTPKNSKNISKSMKSGEEPTELLYRLAWSPIETLLERESAKVFIGKNSVAVIFPLAKIDPENGLVPTQKDSVGTNANTMEGKNAKSISDQM